MDAGQQVLRAQTKTRQNFRVAKFPAKCRRRVPNSKFAGSERGLALEDGESEV